MYFLQKTNEIPAEAEKKIPTRTGGRKALLMILAIAMFLSTAQTLLAVSRSSGGTFQERYLALRNWDSMGYERIAELGYRWDVSMKEADVVWFPGHPFVIRFVHALSGFSWRASTLFASQIAYGMFWIYFLLILRRFQLSRLQRVLAIATIFFYPASFFFVTGYSESLFVGSILGMMYWMHDDRKYALVFALIFAFIVSMTRFTALGLVPLPIIYGLLNRRFGAGFLLSLVLLSGSVLYFSYLYTKFGDFMLYFHTSHAGWGTTPMNIQDLSMHFLWFREPLMNLARSIVMGNGFSLSAFLFVVVTDGLLLFIIFDLLISLVTRNTSLLHRSGYYIGALSLLYLSFTGTFTIGMPSMSRYLLPVIVLGMLGVMHFLSCHRQTQSFAKLAEMVIPVMVVFFAPLHWMYVHNYIIGHGWVY